MRTGRVFMRLELAGATLLSVWLLCAGNVGGNGGWLALLLAGAVVQAVVIGTFPHPLGTRALSLQSALVVLMLGMGIDGTGGALSPILLFYLWIIGFVAWYLPRRATAVQVGRSLGAVTGQGPARRGR